MNDEICHGFPSNRKLKDGDLLTIDMVVNVDGYLADSAWSYAVGNLSDEGKNSWPSPRNACIRPSTS